MPKKEDEPTQKVDMAAIVASEKALAEKAPEPTLVDPPAIMISFDRWFGTTGKPTHHKAGMKAYTKTDGRKTVAQWNAIFASY